MVLFDCIGLIIAITIEVKTLEERREPWSCVYGRMSFQSKLWIEPEKLSQFHTSCRLQQLLQRARSLRQIIGKISNYLRPNCLLQVAADSQHSVDQPLAEVHSVYVRDLSDPLKL